MISDPDIPQIRTFATAVPPESCFLLVTFVFEHTDSYHYIYRFWDGVKERHITEIPVNKYSRRLKALDFMIVYDSTQMLWVYRDKEWCKLYQRLHRAGVYDQYGMATTCS